eukprot:5021794-Amphidinium_carterae.1
MATTMMTMMMHMLGASRQNAWLFGTASHHTKSCTLHIIVINNIIINNIINNNTSSTTSIYSY